MTSERVLLLAASGREIPIPDGMTAEQIFWRHAVMAIPEGICPHHELPLRPVRADPHSGVAAGGHCRECGGYWSVTREQTASWDIDRDPHRGTPMCPAWVLS